MRYIHLTQWSPRESFGGIETIVRITASAQQKRGHTVYVIGRVEANSFEVRRINVDDVTYVEIGFPMTRCPSSLNVGIVGYVRLFREIAVSMMLLTPIVVKILWTERMDAVIFYGIHLLFMAPIVRMMGAKAILGVEVLQKNHKVAKQSWLYWFRRVKYAFFSGIFSETRYFLSYGVKHNIISLLKYYAPGTPVSYIPWGIDVSRVKATKRDSMLFDWKRKTGARIIICPRRLVEEKGVRYILEAMSRIIRGVPNAHLIFTADGVLRPLLEHRANELGIASHIRFTGMVAYPKLLSMMKTADLLVVPSSGEESFGMVFLEGYALRIPIVTTTFGGIVNIVQHNKTGILVEPKNSDALARAIVRLLTNEPLRNRLTENGVRLVEKEFTLERTLDRLDAFVKKILTS